MHDEPAGVSTVRSYRPLQTVFRISFLPSDLMASTGGVLMRNNQVPVLEVSPVAMK